MVTVFGATGFVGGHVCAELRRRNVAVSIPPRDLERFEEPLGDVIYCIGLTADFRTRPFDTIEAHVSKLARILATAKCDSFTYLSSTRIYSHCNQEQVDEYTPVLADVRDPTDLFNLSKLAGESLLLTASPGRSKVIRLSNVYGVDLASDNFISAVMKEGLATGHVLLRSAPTSEKDYISARDAATMIVNIALRGQSRIYNVSRGKNVTNAAIASELASAAGFRFTFAANAPELRFPVVSSGRYGAEFGEDPMDMLTNDLGPLAQQYRQGLVKSP